VGRRANGPVTVLIELFGSYICDENICDVDIMYDEMKSALKLMEWLPKKEKLFLNRSTLSSRPAVFEIMVIKWTAITKHTACGA
jgi:hypothetical protein